MAYTHLTKKELGWIETYYEIGLKPYQIAKKIGRSNQPVYNVVNFLKKGGTVSKYFDRYKQNKSKCGAKKKTFTSRQTQYIKSRVADGLTPDVIIGRGEINLDCSVGTLYRRFKDSSLSRVADGWTPDVIIGRGEINLDCSVGTLYRRFKDSSLFDVTTLPMKGKRKPNGHQETRGKQADKRSLEDRQKAYPKYEDEYGHLEGHTVIGKNHKSAVITFAERVSKLIIALETPGRKAEDIETTLNNWFNRLPKNIFKSITFDCGKEFSNWKSLSNQQDISIFFADPGCPSQRGLNENSNGLQIGRAH